MFKTLVISKQMLLYEHFISINRFSIFNGKPIDADEIPFLKFLTYFWLLFFGLVNYK